MYVPSADKEYLIELFNGSLNFAAYKYSERVGEPLKE